MRRKYTALNAFYDALAVMNRPHIWVPLLLFLGIQLSLVLLYRATFLGPASPLWGLLAPADIRPKLVHYPHDLTHMPLILGRLTFALDALLGVLFRGATVVLFAHALRGTPLQLGEAFRLTARRYRSLLTVSLLSALALVIALGLPSIIAKLQSLPAAAQLALLLKAATHVIVTAAFVYAIPLVVLTGCPAGRAIDLGVRWARHSSYQTILLVVIPLAFEVPTILVGLRSMTLISAVAPEAMIALVVASAITKLLSALLLCGGLTAWLIQKKGDELVV